MWGIEGRATPARVALVVGLIAVAAALLASLARGERRVQGGNNTPVQAVVAQSDGSDPVRHCQREPLVPRGTSALHVAVQRSPQGGPELAAELRRPGRAPVRGVRAAGWTEAGATLELDAPLATEGPALLCIALAPGEPAALLGAPGEPSPHVRVEYLRAGRESWFALAGTVTERMGRGSALGGRAVALLALLLSLGAIATALWRTVRDAP